MEPATFKVVVAGAFGSGKTTLIRQITDTAFVGTDVPTTGDEAEIKATTTVGMEYGTYTVGEGEESVSLALFGVPGQDRFRFMWDIVAEGADGVLLLVDASDPTTWDIAHGVASHLLSVRPVPLLVAISRAGDDPQMLARAVAAVPGAARYLRWEMDDLWSSRRMVVELLDLVLEALDSEPGASPVRVEPMEPMREGVR